MERERKWKTTVREKSFDISSEHFIHNAKFEIIKFHLQVGIIYINNFK